MTRRIGVIGAGPGGLAAAMLLARAGADVTLFERHGRVGGRSATIVADAAPGRFRFDMGPTFFLYPRILEEVFEACGRRLRDEVEMIRLDPQYHLVFETGGRIAATANLDRLEAEVARIAPEDARHVARYMEDNRRKFAACRSVLERPFNSIRDMMRTDLLGALPVLVPPRSVDKDLSRYFGDPRVRLAFSFQSKYLGMSPYRCPSLFSILSYLEYAHGVYHPIGGCGAVTDCMARIAREMGVEILLGEEAKAILFEDRRAVGVRTATGTHAADALVINADFARAMSRLVPDNLRRRWTDNRIARKRFSCSTFMLYLGIEGRHDHLGHHTIYLDEDYVRNLREIEDLHVLSATPSFYVQNACVTDLSLAPPGMSTLYVLVPVTHQHPNVDWSKERDRYRGVVLRQLERIGIPGVERRIRYERIVTPADWEGMGIYRGATFSLAHNLGQMLHLRPRNRFDDLERVYLVGGGTHPGSGLPVIFESARISTRLLLEDFNLPAQFLEPREEVISAPVEETEVAV